MASSSSALFVRVMPAELKIIDSRAKFQMRTRNNFVAHELTKAVNGDKPVPTTFPGAAPGGESVVLFCRFSEELKLACAVRAQEANVPLSQWVRGVLTAN